MSRIIKRGLTIATFLFSTTSILFAQQRRPVPNTPATGTATPAITPSTGGFSAFRSGPRPYKEIITDKARSQRGMVTVHKVEDKYYFELPDSILGKEILAVTRFVQVPWGGGKYGGEEANRNVLEFEKGPDNKIFLRVSLNVVSSPDSTKPIYQAVKNSSVDPIAVAFDIKAVGPDSTSTIIDVTDFFKGDNQIVSLDAGSKRRFGLSGLATDRSFIESMRTYPMNTEIRTVKTFGASGASPFGLSSPLGGSNLPAAQAAGAVTTTINTSLLLLPSKPMPRRAFDPRVGYFYDQSTVFNDSSQKVDENTFIMRWRLEPRDADMEKWKRGELVEPKKPIIYYIDPATPKQWRPYLIAGINDWQAAFEKAGFKNAIQGREWPVDDSSMSLEDARFSAIRYFASDIESAYGPEVHDPRSGEILESHIGWYHNVMKLLHDWYFIQAGPLDARARTMHFSDSLMGSLIRFVSSHEIGHTLGLLHNMGSSSKTPVELLRNKAWVEAHGHTASIMDYARFNYVAQPEDNVGPAGLYPRVGDYDKWAIQWGYRYSGTTDEETDKKIGNKLINDSLSKNPRLWFGTYEFGNAYDPRSQREDLSDNNIKASEYGIKNLKRVVANLPAWTKEEGDRYTNMQNMYGQVIAQFGRYIGHVLQHIGGIYETPKSVEQTGDVYAITPKADQKAALTFLNANLFETPMWLLDKNLLNKFSNPASSEQLQLIQTRYLSSLISSDRLSRLVTSANRDDAAYTADEMLTDLKKGIWSELVTKKPIDNYRRNLQKSYTETLIGLLPVTTPVSSGFVITIGGRGGAIGTDPKLSDVSSIVRGHLSTLAAEIRTALIATTDKMSRYHLQDVLARITSALNPK